MGTYYRENNSESAADLWIKRKVYTTEMQLQQFRYPNFVNFNLAEKFMYGRVDRLFVPMVPFVGSTRRPPGGLLSTSQSIFRNIKQTSNINSQFKALNFVVDAFEGVVTEFEKALAKGQISADDKYLSTLVVSKAYEDPQRYYDIYKKTYFKSIANIMNRNNVKIENFNDFISNLYDILSQTCESVPFTYGSFIKSRRCPINVSGLAIEIATGDSANDQSKIDLFVNSPNWNFYLNVCKEYGFMVDQSEPWRLVADIGSPQMIAFAANHNSESTDAVLQNYYQPAWLTYYPMFSKELLSLYNLCTQQPVMQSEVCGSRAIMTTKFPKKYATPAAYSAECTQRDLFELYFQIRLMEEETEYTEPEKEKLINQAMTWADSGRDISGFKKSLNVFETFANKPFDYRGSLTYNNNEHVPAYRARQEEQDDTGELVITPDSQTTSGGGGY